MSQRKELRTSESSWRGMSPTHRAHQKPLPPVKNRSGMRIVLIICIAVLMGFMLWNQQQKCESTNGAHSRMCVD